MAIDVDRYHFQSLCAMAQANRDFTKHVAALVFDRPIARGNSWQFPSGIYRNQKSPKWYHFPADAQVSKLCFNPTWHDLSS
jgi:hypothetical protein